MTKLRFLKNSAEANKVMHDTIGKKFQLGGNLLKTATNLAPYASNIVNAFRKLPKVRKPEMNNMYVNPELIDYDADIAETDRLIRGLDQGITTANQSTGNAIKAANLGKFLEQRNKLRQAERTGNAGITNRAREINSQINEQNVDRENQYRAAKTEREVVQQRLQSENLANAADKFQQQQRDKKMFELEGRKIDLLPTLYKDNKVVTRNMLGDVNKEREIYGLPPLTHEVPPTTTIVPQEGLEENPFIDWRRKKFGGNIQGVMLTKGSSIARKLGYV